MLGIEQSRFLIDELDQRRHVTVHTDKLGPLLKDYRQNIPAMIEAANRNARDIGFFYLCNPNNPTGTAHAAKTVKDAIAAGILASIVCGIVGTLVVVRRIVSLSGSVSHSAFGGIGLGKAGRKKS